MAVTVQSKPKEPNFNHKTVKMSSPNVNFDQCVCACIVLLFGEFPIHSTRMGKTF